MPLEKLKYLKEEGFPVKVKALLNDCAMRINREWVFKFDTTSLNPIVKVEEDEYKVTVTIPRGALVSNSDIGPWGITTRTVSGVEKIAVSSNSSLGGANSNVQAEYTIDHLGDAFSLIAGQVLYLEYDISGATVTNVTLKGGNTWGGFPAFYHATGGSADKGYFLIAYAGDNTDPAVAILDGPVINGVKIVRCIYNPLWMLFFNTGDGFIIPYPSPPGRPFRPT